LAVHQDVLPGNICIGATAAGLSIFPETFQSESVLIGLNARNNRVFSGSGAGSLLAHGIGLCPTHGIGSRAWSSARTGDEKQRPREADAGEANPPR